MRRFYDDEGLAFPTPNPEIIEDVLGPWKKARLNELTQKVIHRLSRLKASRIFEGYSYRSIWGEYSHHVQTGDYLYASDILDDLADDACRAVADSVPAHEMDLFDQLAHAFGEEDGMSGYEYLLHELKDLVSTKASIRELDRYSDDYRWYENL